MRMLVIELPQLPPGCLNPNARKNPKTGHSLHWSAKSAAAKDYGYLVKMFALNEMHAWQMEHNKEWLPLARARVTLEFTWPSDRPGPMPDIRNLEASMEAGINALTARRRGETKKGEVIVGARIIVDDGPGYIEWGPTVLQRGPEEQVRIIIEEMERG